jgi:integrase
MIAFAALSGMRDSAIVSLQLRHVRVEEELIEQLPAEGVQTKASKTIHTFFFPVGEDIKQIVLDWIQYLYRAKLYGSEAPLFPRTKLSLDSNNEFKPDGLEPHFWKSANRVRQIFREAFTRAGLPYFNPHTFRNMLALLGEKVCPDPEVFKIWSQNLGHSKVLTTFFSYGEVSAHRQGEVMKALAKPRSAEGNDLQEIKMMLSDLVKNKEKVS